MNDTRPKKVLITGANGFIGSALMGRLEAEPGLDTVGAVRTLRTSARESAGLHAVGDIGPNTDWGEALAGIQSVVHCAGRAHVMLAKSADPLPEYRRTNVEGTLTLARQAAKAGVERLVYISSIGVNGNVSRRPFRESDVPNPVEPYAVSKYEAEQGLSALAEASDMEVVIIRPPLVYGAGAPGNFGTLMKWMQRGVPLPFGAINNRRTLVGLDNLVDLIVTCLHHPAAPNQVFLAGDDEDLSTTDLLRRIGRALGKPARLIPVPARLLEIAAIAGGRRALARRLLGSLQVDIGKARAKLGWKPPLSVDEALRKAARSVQERRPG